MADEAVIGEDAPQVGCPSNTMPKKSKASRSYQFADGQMSITDAHDRKFVVRREERTRSRQLLASDSRW